MIPTRDITRLNDMISYAKEAIEFGAGKSAADLDDDRRSSLAIVRCIEVVGEAAAHVSADTRARLPDIPWPAVVGMRNILIHGYWKVAHTAIVLTVNNRLPLLVNQLEAFIAENQTP